ncbi:hypothetical protein ACWDAO_14805 [Streptomyces sp. NPDC001212]
MDELEVRRLSLAVGLATARRDEQALMGLLSGLDPDVAGALLVGLATSWVGVLELLLAEQGHADPGAAVLELLRQEALEAAAE